MKFKIDPKIFEKFTGVEIGIIIAKDLDNNGSVPEIEKATRAEEKRIREQFESETLSQDPHINIWRQAYSLFGGKPKENKSSIENLYKLILKGGELRRINKLVDVYNYISLKYMLPVGGEDIDKMKGDVTLTFASENEPSVLLLGDHEARSPHPGEVIYKDEQSAICRRWNWREAERTKLTEKTKNCVLVIEGLPPVTQNKIKKATDELKVLIEKYCGGNLKSDILDKDSPEVLLD
jgi:DNA/RNA-binding domain of Phe-tRNA-synthetase-like protein